MHLLKLVTQYSLKIIIIIREMAVIMGFRVIENIN